MPTPPIFSGCVQRRHQMSLAGPQSTISIIKPSESRKWNIHTERETTSTRLLTGGECWQCTLHTTQFILIRQYWLHSTCVKTLRKCASAMAERTKINDVLLQFGGVIWSPKWISRCARQPKNSKAWSDPISLFAFWGWGSCASHKSVNKFNKL